MTNPNNAVGTNAAYDGRTSVNAFNDDLAAYTSGILSGWACTPNSGLTVSLGGNGSTRDVAVAEDNAGNKTSINNISGSPIDVTMSAAPGSNSRIDLVVAYVDNPPQGVNTTADNPSACGIIKVTGTASSSPVAPNDSAIRTAITGDGASGTTAYYVILAYITISSGTTDLTSNNIKAGANAGIGPNNINYSAFPSYETHATSEMNIGSGSSSYVTVLSLNIATPGKYYVYGYCGIYKSSNELADFRLTINGGNWSPYSINHLFGNHQYSSGSCAGIITITSPNTTITLRANQTNSNITVRTEYLRNMCAFRVG